MDAAIQELSIRQQWHYAIGQLGWSTLINIIGLQLVYFYLPPQGTDISMFITQVVFWGVFNAVTLIAASGRILDALTDPLIANWSDRYDSRQGRRLPFMKWSAIPAAILCALLFFPLTDGISTLNIIWLIGVQALFYIALTFYVTPYSALIPEFGHSSRSRLNISTYISMTYALGIVLASQAPLIGKQTAHLFFYENTLQTQIQSGTIVLCIVSAICMLWPCWILDEKRHSKSAGANIPVLDALRHTYQNAHFRYYVVADFSYFTGLTIIMTGLLYYITVLLELGEELMGVLLPSMVVLSFIFYPIVNLLAKRVGKKILMVGSFFFLSGLFMMTYFLGRVPLDPTVQAFALVVSFSIPAAFLGILPNAVLADIADDDARRSGWHQEGMFFASRTLLQKLGLSFGVFLFAALTSFGKDVGDDLGIRLSALCGAVLCLVAGLYFSRYREYELEHSA